MLFEILDLNSIKIDSKRRSTEQYTHRYDFVTDPIFLVKKDKELGYVEDFVHRDSRVYAKIVVYDYLNSDTILKPVFRDDGSISCIRFSNKG